MSLSTRLALVVATFFGAGLAPKAPGTVGTLAAVPLVWAASQFGLTGQLIALVVVIALGIPAAAATGRHYGPVDSQQIVIDEVAGLLVTMLAVPFNPATAIAGVLLFRLFDITKPWPASYFDTKVKNAAGVILDDVAAGLYARACLAALMAWLPSTFGT